MASGAPATDGGYVGGDEVVVDGDVVGGSSEVNYSLDSGFDSTPDFTTSKSLKVEDISEHNQMCILKDEEEEEDEEEKKEKVEDRDKSEEEKGGKSKRGENVRSSLIISGVIIAVIGAIFAMSTNRRR